MRTLALFTLALVVLGCRAGPTCADLLEAGQPSQDRFHREPHQLAILEQGFESLIQRVALLRAAKTSVDIQTFIWADDVTGRFFLDECVRTAQRGVRVRIIVDGMFCTLAGPPIAAAVAQNATLSFKLYNPLNGDLTTGAATKYPSIFWSPNRINQRMHTKLILVDQRFMLMGGRNIEDSYFDIRPGLNFHDRDVIVEGPVVADAQTSFNKFYGHELVVDSTHLTRLQQVNATEIKFEDAVAHSNLAQLRSGIDQRLLGQQLLDHEPWTTRPFTTSNICYHADPPGKASRADGLVTKLALSYLLCAANEEILLQSPYFVTTTAAREFFDDNEERSTPLSIRVHTNSLAATDSWVTYSAYQREKRLLVHYDHLQLHEAKPRPLDLADMWSSDPIAVALRARNGDGKAYLCLHSKTLVIDRKIGMIGTYNLDPRSANINTEAMLQIDDPKIAAMFATSIDRDMAAQNSWVAAKRYTPLGSTSVNDILARTSHSISEVLMLDLWPIANTTLYELREGQEPCSHSHPEFFDRYEALGSYPEIGWDSKILSAELLRMTGAVLTPTL